MRRRLWPVALLLVAALVAVPLLLAKEPEAARPPRRPTAKQRRSRAGDVRRPRIGRDGRRRRRRQAPPRPGRQQGPVRAAPSCRRPRDEDAAKAATDAATARATSRPTATREVRRLGRRADDAAGGAAPTPRPRRVRSRLYSLTVRFGAPRATPTARARRAPDGPAGRGQPAARLPRRGRQRQGRDLRAHRRRRGRGRRDLRADPGRLRVRSSCGPARPSSSTSTDRDGRGHRGQFQLDLVKITRSRPRSAGRARRPRREPLQEACAPAKRRRRSLRYRYDIVRAPAEAHRAVQGARRSRQPRWAPRRVREARAAGRRPRRARGAPPHRMLRRAIARRHRRGVPRARPDRHRRGPARRARARPGGRSTATWRAASSATAAAAG